MKKSVIAVSVILLVAAGIVMPAGYFGQVTENTLKSRMANMPYGVGIEVVDYRRGWFSSTARLEWQPPGDLAMPVLPPGGALEGAPEADFVAGLVGLASGPVAIDLEIAHGPVFFAVEPGVGLFNARGRIDLGDSAPQDEAEPSGDQANYIDVYLSSFSGGTVSNRLEFDDLNWYLQPVSVRLTGGRLAGEWIGPGAFQLQHVVLQGMDVSTGMPEGGYRASLSDIEVHTEYPQGLDSGAIMAPSESSSSIGEAHVEGSQGNTFMHMTGLSSLSSTSVGEDGLFRIDGRVEIESLDVMGREFAPVEWNQEAGGLSEDAMLKLMAALSEGILETPPASGLPEDEPQAPSAGVVPGVLLPELTAEFREAMRELMTAAPYANIGAVATYQGEQALELNVRQAFHPDRVPDGVDMTSVSGIVASLDYALDIEMSKAAAEELVGEDLLQSGLSQGLLEQTETAYSVSVALQEGTVELNGRALPIALPTAAPTPPAEEPVSPFEGADEPTTFGEADEPTPFDRAMSPASD